METQAIDFGILSIVPPFLAILLAIITRQVILSLFVGIWMGATFLMNNNPFYGLLHIMDRFVQPAVADPDHAAIIIFSVMLGGLVGIISRSGGTAGLVNIITSLAKKRRGGQLVTWFLGVAIFFDDYANTLIVGNTMRPITDKLRVSREKLSFIVDSTAAPIAALTLSTWIGYEIGLIGDALPGTAYDGSAFSVFLNCIPYAFYPILAVIFVLQISLTGRDFGPMLKAERRAFSTGEVSAKEVEQCEDLTGLTHIHPRPGIKPKWFNAAVPIMVVIAVSIIGLYTTGREAALAKGAELLSWQNILGNASAFQSLFWASLFGCITAIAMAVSQKILSVEESINAWFLGARSMFLAMIILVLAWSIGAVTKEMGTADYLTGILHGAIHPGLVPALTFILAGIMSFATGTSWGTMAILIPLVVPLAWSLSAEAGLSAQMIQTIFFASTSSVLAGAIFGDHCSPISDTTVMSSMASACNHVDHVRTQMPYAISIAAVSLFAGALPAGFGFSPWISLAISAAALLLILKIFGKRAES